MFLFASLYNAALFGVAKYYKKTSMSIDGELVKFNNDTSRQCIKMFIKK